MGNQNPRRISHCPRARWITPHATLPAIAELHRYEATLLPRRAWNHHLRSTAVTKNKKNIHYDAPKSAGPRLPEGGRRLRLCQKNAIVGGVIVRREVAVVATFAIAGTFLLSSRRSSHDTVRRGGGMGRGGGGGYACVAGLRHLTIDHASFRDGAPFLLLIETPPTFGRS